ncbi:MAG TPA: DUF4249 domain-containing protein [Lentimicrobium sp.]|nr:DUF4249 domain-containing protein [Lentimicrobium sp.]
MKLRYFLSAFLILLVTFLQSCESMVSDVDAPSSPPKLVVTSFISSNMPYISVNVYKTRPLYSTSYNTDIYPPVKTAIVILSDGNNTVTLPYDEESMCYRIRQTEMEISKGKTYYLKVTDGDLHAEAECTVPSISLPEFEVVNIDTTIDEDYGQISYHANLRFKDSIGEGQFYHVTVSSVFKGDIGTVPTIYEIGFSRGEPFVSDKGRDGNYFTYTTNDIYLDPGQGLELVLSIGITDENYYNYHKAIYDFQDDNPFAEPSPIYSNIKGGLGVFGSYVQQVSVNEYK